MSLQRNYYEVLGVPQAATTDQIKKKYRELARQWHPDVVQDKNMGQRVFSQINQAYRILGDQERRAQYDSTLAKAASNNGTSSNGTSNGTSNGMSGSGVPRNGTTSNGSYSTAQAPQANRPSANGAATATPPEQPVPAQKLEAIAARLRDADNAIMAGKPVEAGAFCMKVLEMDPRNVRALDIFGDALVQQGKREDAAVQYRKALQVAPSHSIQAKLNRLDQAATSNRTNPIGQPPPAKKPDLTQSPPPKKPEPAQSGDKAGGLFGRFLGRK